MLYLLQQGLCQWVDCDCVHGPVETDLHEPRRFKAGLRRVPSSLTSANSPIRTPAHPLPERYLARRKSAPRQGLSHVCPLVCARHRGGLCHRAVLCRYEQCCDGSRKPRPITRLLDRGQSTKVLFLFSCGNQLTRRRFSYPLAQYNPSVYTDTEAFCRAFRSQCVNYAGGINQHHQLDCVFERPDGSRPQPGPKIRAFCGGIEKKPDGSWDTKRTPVQDNVRDIGP